MNLYELLTARQTALSVVGLGYVGLPLAVAFAEKVRVVGFDVNVRKVEQYREGKDVTREVGDHAVVGTTATFTADEAHLRECKFHVVAVPTPINAQKTPDLTPVTEACRIIGRNLVHGSIVVFESTVYPGVTEDICIPILERESGLVGGEDFGVGYSPERINPGDKTHRLENIVKIVSGMNEGVLEEVAKVYELIIDAGVYRAESIRVAEAAKIIENAQRDINIAFMNELSMVFDRMGIDTMAVLKAAATKWNFLRFTPGLVGGHCIGVDPYYFVYKAEELGYHSQIILAGRRINDEMGRHVASSTVKRLIQAGVKVRGSRVAIFGITFKEDCPDCRNTRVVDIVTELKDYGIAVSVVDPIADAEEVKSHYNIDLCAIEQLDQVDGVVVAVPHASFLELSTEDLRRVFRSDRGVDNKPVLIDVKGIFQRSIALEAGFVYWSL